MRPEHRLFTIPLRLHQPVNKGPARGAFQIEHLTSGALFLLNLPD